MSKRVACRCEACGKTFFAGRGRLPTLCLVCRIQEAKLNKRKDQNRTRAALAEAELMRRGNGRICHDCGKPTPDYRCAACWAKRRGLSDSHQKECVETSLTDGEYIYA